ncbi:non-hydrolyzing UDP-N-acetylglucosamine 2-epimerase [Curtobacterium sp. BH-2-1-1]|uniref:non-hydrolyzing UDP-N-acetylglucosamine 2-epimerase n=1 Tax=Curtobacterium sp. BH-2-1-1 TaxID=1905847 RepID=UPI0011A88F68|nr:UDP-N-acetylglucosamine 2-epimerase (non-hydrolyzing) [Curtobacterium sp. BH-2-1-1]
MKILSVVGARPQFVKLAPVARALAGRCEHVIVHTGQHYDPAMSDVFFDDLAIPQPSHQLEVGSATHGAQTGRMLERIEAVCSAERPDAVLVYGDTNSTLAGALAAVKLHIPTLHLEAGLRSFARTMPEEINRVATDHTVDRCLAPTAAAMAHLEREGLGERSRLVGDVMTDVLFAVRDAVAGTAPRLPAEIGTDPYVVATFHRPTNTDDPERLTAVLEGLASVGRRVLLLAHPRLRASAARHRLLLDRPGVVVADPVSYPELVRTVRDSVGVVTDSGGLQKEAFLLQRPTVTVRSETEWVETVDLGWNTLVGDDPTTIGAAFDDLTTPITGATPYGDGHSARLVADEVLEVAGAVR